MKYYRLYHIKVKLLRSVNSLSNREGIPSFTILCRRVGACPRPKGGDELRPYNIPLTLVLSRRGRGGEK
jgi:hypothetical protein